MRILGPRLVRSRYVSLPIFFILIFSIASFGNKPNGKGGGNTSSPLTISNVGPNSGPPAGGTTVTITGTGFTHSASVAFGGATAPAVAYISSTELQVTTPSHASGTVSVAVNENPHNQSTTLSGGFTYSASTTTSIGVSSISPTQGPTGGGTVVTVNGTGFQSGATVKFGSTASSVVNFVSSTQINATSPPESAGTVAITVTDPNSQSSSLPSAFTYTSGTSVTSVSPTQGPTSGGTVVTVNGTGFQSGATVKFGSTASSAVTVTSSTQIDAMAPAESAGTVAITVTDPNSQSSSLSSAYTYTSAPSVSSVSPTSGPVTGGTTVTILGSGFQTGANVTFGSSAAASVTLVSSTEIQAVSPSSTAGTVAITVTNSGSQSGTLSGAFTFFHTVSLTWKADTSSVTGYNVYRGSTSGGPYTRINSTTVSGTSFTDSKVQAGQTYFYVTTAVNNNSESGYSNQAQAAVPSP